MAKLSDFKPPIDNYAPPMVRRLERDRRLFRRGEPPKGTPPAPAPRPKLYMHDYSSGSVFLVKGTVPRRGIILRLRQIHSPGVDFSVEVIPGKKVFRDGRVKVFEKTGGKEPIEIELWKETLLRLEPQQAMGILKCGQRMFDVLGTGFGEPLSRLHPYRIEEIASSYSNVNFFLGVKGIIHPEITDFVEFI